ncbi:MAG: tRNA dimethylallyltransferase [Porticoccaceae bacterium]|nr:MAG: tRNA dimethylallyltransferase [Porticoccaceae bacterium]
MTVAEASWPLVLLMGPTASGKTELALRLAEALPVEVVSVDSVQVYRGLDLGSAKPDRAARERVPHHLIDVRDPRDVYSAAEFARDAARLVREIRARGRLPLLVGGTMLYFRVLLEGLAPLPPPRPELRAELEAEARRRGWPALHRELAEVDPELAARIHPHQWVRIQRALEIHRSTGRRPSELWRAATAGIPPLAVGERICALALVPDDRGLLHRRIADRFRAMLQAGLVEEVAALRARGDLSPELPALRAVGYRQVWAHLAGALSRAEMEAAAIAATRQLAKRQLTWLRNWAPAHPLRIDRGGRPRPLAELAAEVLGRLETAAPPRPAALPAGARK